MNIRLARKCLICLLSVWLCHTTQVMAASAAKSAAKPRDPRTEWLGKWIGPEGTFLQLSPQREGYRIVIQSLDARRSVMDTAIRQDRIQFRRDGKTRQIRAGNGRDTGMKWLSEKQNCLIVEVGEGYCR